MKTKTLKRFTLRKVSLPVLLLSSACFFVLLASIALLVIYWHHDSLSGLARVVPYPAVITSQGTIWYKDISRNMEAVERFYVSQDFASQGIRIDFSTSDGKKKLKMKEKDLLNKLLEDKVLSAYLDENKRKVTDAETAQNIDRILAETGSGGSAKENIKKLYGWDMNEFADRVVYGAIVRERSSALFEELSKNDPQYLAARKKIDEAAQHAKGGADEFAVAAQKYSEGVTAKNSGVIGWVFPQNIDPAVSAVVTVLKPGQISSVIEGNFGFHVILLNDTRSENGADLYNISQIFVRKPLLSDWLAQKMKEQRVRVLLPEYRWNSDTGYIEFEDETLRAFEQEGLHQQHEAASSE